MGASNSKTNKYQPTSDDAVDLQAIHEDPVINEVNETTDACGGAEDADVKESLLKKHDGIESTEAPVNARKNTTQSSNPTKTSLAPEGELFVKEKPCPYDYTNLILEGGGNKGLAYCGAIKILDEKGIFSNLYRYAGSSAGAMMATLLAFGYSSSEIEDIARRESPQTFLDAKFGIVSLLWNLIRHKGWHPGKRVETICQFYAEKKFGNPKLSFMELYEKSGRELCIIVTNLTTMSVEYFHPKTTPDVSIALAVRMSAALPGMVQPVILERHGIKHCYIDGGVLCNYPIHCFDGWYLSMDPKDSFFRRLENMSSTTKENMFREHNTKTLGLLLYSGDESEYMMQSFEERRVHVKRPNTPLAKKNGKHMDARRVIEQKRAKIFEAAREFWQALRTSDIDGSDTVNINELRLAIDKSTFNENHSKALFSDSSLETIFNEIDINNDGEISFHEFIHFMEKKSVAFMCYMQRMSIRDDVDTVTGFLSAFQEMLDVNLKQLYMKERDMERTIGINTDYIRTTDFELQDEDKDFLIKCGQVSTSEFFK
ncbi:unnamed protein product [Owenia fusiformis]|uniref:Uncharacterized protein n=1 Tax=Owenia fusiformis TaxID=6347 RepID=A0A8J1XZS3_OWEFU|nr:unnamed protein product [Owenia fusiformis]